MIFEILKFHCLRGNYWNSRLVGRFFHSTIARSPQGDEAISKRTDTHTIASQIVREIVIPEITKEVNTGKNFALLRQIYQALILAKWYKETIQNGLLDAVYTNKKKIAGVNVNDPAVKDQIYERYLKAYKKGAFNYIKEDPTPDGQIVPRKYFSGGTLMVIHLDPTGKQSEIKGPDGAMLSIIVTLKEFLKRMTETQEDRDRKVLAANPGSRIEVRRYYDGRTPDNDPDVVSNLGYQGTYTGGTQEVEFTEYKVLVKDQAMSQTPKQTPDAAMTPTLFDIMALNPGEGLSFVGSPHGRIYSKDQLKEVINEILRHPNRGQQGHQEFFYLMYSVHQDGLIKDFFNDLKAKMPKDWHIGFNNPSKLIYTLWIDSNAVESLLDFLRQVEWYRTAFVQGNPAWGPTWRREVALAIYNQETNDFDINTIVPTSERPSRRQSALELLDELTKVGIVETIGNGQWKLATMRTRQILRILAGIEQRGSEPHQLRQENSAMLAGNAIVLAQKVTMHPGAGLNQKHIAKMNHPTQALPFPDRAMKGGIDLNQINVLRNGKTVNVQFDPAQLNALMQGGFEGFTPVIINMTRISSPFQLLGINPAKGPEALAKV